MENTYLIGKMDSLWNFWDSNGDIEGISKWEGGLKHGSDSAYYKPSLDMVVMPDRSTFKNDEAYLSTLAHEFSHATGSTNRLDRAWLKGYSKRSNRA